jgi:hypothetical protein
MLPTTANAITRFRQAKGRGMRPVDILRILAPVLGATSARSTAARTRWLNHDAWESYRGDKGMGHRLVFLVSVVILVLSTPALGRQLASPASSFETRDEREAFLARASFATDAPTDGRPSWRAGLADGTLRHDASVVTEDGSGPTTRNYRFNVAAYELDKLLGLSLVPPSVERTVNGRPASVTWWVDNFAMNELDRRRKGIDPPDPDRWSRQVQAVRVFDELISNTYRDTAPPLYLNSVWDNLLITTDWTIWIIDHTGAFRARRELQDPDNLVRCPALCWVACEP